jgi:hypothetical protein
MHKINCKHPNKTYTKEMARREIEMASLVASKDSVFQHKSDDSSPKRRS